MSIDDTDCASAIREKNLRSLQEMLKKKGQRSKPKLESKTLLTRCVVSLLVMGLLAGVGFGLYKLREAEKTNEAVYIIPIVIQGIMLLLPWLFSVISQLEKWSAQDGIFVRLTRSFLLAGVMLGVIVGFSLSLVTSYL
ncbi:uncharacterized protein LOC111704606 [Eurytemora carolleeae]|uniref:uncharacterized protein LOC111704606 n=1 Tax=Eurytemora carolleeae TaxID=1294199 RepID=UPI000C77B885|nr:uncharacterized protein LOC111704606 [Eurytemora carolleeae]|eukprot:XP_023332660.1 uncharacterized protein LOC111704606 [Eurytemora affinis]